MLPYLHIPALELGPFTIQAFGVIAAVAVILGVQAMRHRTRKLGLDPCVVDRLVPWLFIGVIIGAHLISVGLYEFLYLLPLTALLYALRRYHPFSNFHIALVLLVYTPVRFFLDFLREIDVRYYGLTPGQYFSVLFFLLGLGLVWYDIHFVLIHHRISGIKDRHHETTHDHHYWPD